MVLEMGRNASSDQEKKHEESIKRFGHRISNQVVEGKSVPEVDQQMAKIQTHAIFEKHFREEIKQSGIKMREDDLQKIMFVHENTLRTINNKVDRITDVPPSFKVTPIFDKNEPQAIYGADAEELNARYPIDKLREAAERAMEKTREEIRTKESSNVIDEL